MGIPRHQGLSKSLVEMKREMNMPVVWYVVSDQETVRDSFRMKHPQYVITTSCDMTHTNRARVQKGDPGFVCALVENYLLSSSDVLVLTTRSTYGYLARHRTNAPYVTINLGDYDEVIKKGVDKTQVPIEKWDVEDV